MSKRKNAKSDTRQKMNQLYLSYLVCPICRAGFAQTGNMLICANKHTFDISREGYLYLLQTRLPGDTKEMVQARRSFFARGHYQPLSDELNRIILLHAGLMEPHTSSPIAILDAGCGEGYYLQNLQISLTKQAVNAICFGLDLSKEAVRLAARQSRECLFLVANMRDRLSFVDNSFIVLINVFAPRNPSEFARIIAPGGLLVVIIPTPEHLQRLRSTLHLLTIEEQKQQHVIAQFTEQGAFLLETNISITYDLDLKKDEIAQLVTMTPNYWHITDETRQAMEQLEEMHTEVACSCLVFRRQSISL